MTALIRKYWSKLLILFAWIFMLVVSWPMFFVVKANYGDLLFSEQLFIDIFENHGSWASWAHPPAAAFLPDLPLYAIGYFLLDHTMDRVFFAGIGHAILIALSANFLITTLLNRVTINGKILVLLIVSIVSYCAYTTNMIMYFNATNSHVGSLIFSIFCTALLLKFYRTQGKTWLLMLLLSSAVAIVSGGIFLIWFVAPALITLAAILLILFRMKYRGRYITDTAILFAAVILSFLLAHFIAPFFSPWSGLELGGRTSWDINVVARAASIQVKAIYDIVTSKNIAFYILMGTWLAGLLLAVFGMYKYSASTLGRMLDNHIEQEITSRDFVQYFFTLLTLVVVVFSFLGIVVSGEFKDILSIRYYMTPIALPMAYLIMWLVNANFLFFNSKGISLLFCVVMATVLGYYMNNFDKINPSKLTIDEVREHTGRWEKELTDCLDRHADEFNLTYGLSDFWRARPITLLSKKGLRVYPLHFNSVLMRHYMSNIDWFFGAKGYDFPEPVYNFVVISAIDLDPTIFNMTFGPPSASFSCPQDSTVMVYNKETNFDQQWKMINKPLLEQHLMRVGRTNHIHFVPLSLLTRIGVMTEDSIYAKQGENVAGYLSGGPYISLTKGKYRVKITYYSQNANSNDDIGKWDVFYTWKVLAEGPLVPSINGEEKQITAEFEVDSMDEGNAIEIRTFYSGKGDLYLKSIDLEKL